VSFEAFRNMELVTSEKCILDNRWLSVPKFK